MGEVWLGRHEGQGIPVAIKLLRAQPALDPAWRRAFEQEIHQVARLDHPGIVMVLDHGVVPGEVAASAGDTLPAGAPYLVMEYLSGGSLAELCPVPSFEAGRVLLLELLGALAHAHARGVLHRDIKPQNVLRAGPTDLRPGLRLTDFGLASGWGLEMGAAGQCAGTPAYMAPEQVEGRWRDQGPWTDLYAVGCLAWELWTGDPPFGFGPARRLLDDQVLRPPPPFSGGPGMPQGLSEWLCRLLAKEPSDRFDSAPSAAAALRALPDPLSQVVVEGPFNTLAPTLELPRDLGTPSMRPMEDRIWTAPPQLLGAGLGLVGLRPVPLQGREAERAELQATLSAVSTDRRPRLVLLEGGPGLGKRRLASWLAEWAEERGEARSLALPSTEGDEPMLLAGLRALLGLGGLSSAAAARRVGGLSAHPFVGSAALAEDLAGLFQSVPVAPDLLTGAWLRLLSHLSTDRPVVLTLPQGSHPDALSLIQRLLDHEFPLGVLVLLPLVPTQKEADPFEGQTLARLRAHPRVQRLALLPLSRPETGRLVGSLAVLDEELQEMVVEQSGGNPLYAVQLVGDWIRRGLLEPGGQGFRLRHGARPRLPDDLHAVWLARLDTLLGQAGEPARRSLVAAAIVGVEVEAAAWAVACGVAGVELAWEVVDRMGRAGLAERTEVGWRFRSVMLRECLERDAQSDPAWVGMNLAIARLLEEVPGAVGRVGRHRLDAGDLKGCLDPLLQSVAAHLGASAFSQAWRELELVEGALDRLEGGPADPARLAAQVSRLRLLVARGRLADAEALAARTAEQARRARQPALRERAIRYRAMALEKRGEGDLAEALFTQAELLAEALGDQEELAICLEHRGSLLRNRGDASSSQGLADCLKEIGGTLVTLGSPEAAAGPLREAIRLYQHVGDRAGRAQSLNNLGDVLRRSGDLSGAEQAYTEALELLERLGNQGRSIPLLNLALVRIAQGRPAESRALAEQGLQLAERGGRKLLRTYAHVVLLPGLAAADDRPALREHLDRARALLDETGLVDPDLAACARAAAQAARASGAEGLAEEAEAIANGQEERRCAT